MIHITYSMPLVLGATCQCWRKSSGPWRAASRCRRLALACWRIIFLEETLRHRLSKYSTLQYVYHFIFLTFLEYWQKTRHPLYLRSLHVGIARIDCWWEQLTIQQTHSPWCGICIQKHGNGKSAHPTPGSICGRGWPMVVWKGFI